MRCAADQNLRLASGLANARHSASHAVGHVCKRHCLSFPATLA
jgi:hypothetical protein